MKIKKNDIVLVISGKYRGKKGKVLRILPDEGKILVEGINLAKKHQKAKKQGEKGQIVELPKPIDASNVKLFCPKCSKASRVGFSFLEGQKVRICKKCHQEIQ